MKFSSLAALEVVKMTTSSAASDENFIKFSSLAALEVVKMTTSSAASDENFIKMTTFSFQWRSPTPCGVTRPQWFYKNASQWGKGLLPWQQQVGNWTFVDISGGWEFDRSHGAGTSSPSHWQQVEEQAPKPVGWTMCFLLMTLVPVQRLCVNIYVYIYMCTFLIRVLL